MVIKKTTALLVQTQIASAINKISMIMLETTAALIRTKRDEFPSITKTRITALYRNINHPTRQTTTRINDDQAVCNRRPHKATGLRIAQIQTAAAIIIVRSQPHRCESTTPITGLKLSRSSNLKIMKLF